MPPSPHQPAPRVLITGGAGFIGSEVARALAADGCAVVSLDLDARQPRLDDLGDAVTRVAGDVRDPALVDRLVAAADRVLHLSAVVGIDDYLARPRDVLDVNVLGTRHVLAACLAHGRPVVVASSSETYGKNEAVLGEGADRVLGSAEHPRWSYAISKMAAEEYARAFAREGLACAIVRYFNVYGPRIDAPGEGRVISRFLGALQRGEPLRLVGGGEAVRSFCYVDDAVRATAGLLLALGPGSPLAGRAFNVGRDEDVPIRDLARRMIALSGRAVGLEDVTGEAFYGAGFEEIPRRVPDTRALADALGFEAEVGLDEGLRRTLAPWGLLAEAPAPPPPPAPLPVVRPVVEPIEPMLRAMRGAMRTGQLTNGGPLLRRFEAALAARLGAADVAATSSGADALLLALLALGLRGRAALPSYTYVATLNAVVWAGLEPVFCDVDPATWTLDPADLARIAAEGPLAAVVPVNVFGVPPDLAAVAAVAARAGARVVYDDAHGLGTEVDGRPRHGPVDVEILSFHATKMLPAAEGGAVVADDPALLREVRRLASHGLPEDRLAATPGFNAKLDEVRAAMALEGLGALDGALARRRAYAARLRDAMEAGGLLVPQRVPPGVRSCFLDLGGLATDRAGGPASLAARLAARGVGTRRYFDPPLHHLRAFAGGRPLPATEAVWGRLLGLPLHSRMAESDLRRVEEALLRAADEAP